MIRFTFKNVDQGDSILIEWIDDSGNEKIAIVDCNLKEDLSNPVLEHIRRKEYKVLDYLILSHPHLDHYSGFNGLLEYCENNGVIVNWFLHTSSQVPEFLKTSAISSHASDELSKLFLKIRQLIATRVILDHGYITDISREIQLNKDIKLKFLSPSTLECDNFIRNVPIFHEEDGSDNPNANWLSTLIKVYSEKWFVLLTSDVDKSVLLRIGTRKPEELNNCLFIGQSPHHGSRNNHRNSFWKTGIKSRIENTPIIFSVGRNIYRHPSQEAVDFFRKNGFDLYSTNQVGHLNTIDDKEVYEKSLFLDALGKVTSSSGLHRKFNGDKIFTIVDEKLTYLG